MLPEVVEAVVLKIAAGRAVERDELVLVDFLAIASVGFGWVVVDDGDADVGVAAFAEAIAYCELEGELGVGGDEGGGEGGSGGFRIYERYRIAAAVDLMPEVVEAAVFAIFAFGAVERDELVFVDLLAIAGVGFGWVVVKDGDDDGGIVAGAGGVGYC